MRLTFQTPTAIIGCNLLFEEVSAMALAKYQSKETFDSLCQNGCSNYKTKWSCPPFAPCYSSFVSQYKWLLLVVLSTEMNQFSYIKNDYLKIKAANTILKSRVDKALRSYISDDCFYISTGSCRLCKPCKCKMNQPCAHPEKMSYSFEALGINVSMMISDIFDFELQWYKKKSLPQYTSVVAGLLYNSSINKENLFERLSK